MKLLTKMSNLEFFYSITSKETQVSKIFIQLIIKKITK